jgi:2-C-methyl-D-erythritol 4-phosphate cytidylyltransferase
MNDVPEKITAIIVAGGRGNRMHSDLPKQFLELAGKPILMHTIEAFHRFSPTMPIVLVLPADQIQVWISLCKKYCFDLPLIIRDGGMSRFQSVRNGLEMISDEGFVAVHDGVRPLVSKEIIAESFASAALYGSAVAAVPLKESIREVQNDLSRAIERSKFRIIQTPQTFRSSLLKQAYRIEEHESLTDDASVAEKAGNKIFLFPGSYFNIKVTTPEDILIAEKLMEYQSQFKGNLLTGTC